MGLALVTAPTETPISVGEARTYCRVEDASDDALLGDLIEAAVDFLEEHTGRAYVTQTWTYFLDTFGPSRGEILLPKPPLQSISAVRYYDADNVQQTLGSSTYEFRAHTTDGHGLRLATGETWPTIYDRTDAVEIEMVVGYGAATLVPPRAKLALRHLVFMSYDWREPLTAGQVSKVPGLDRLLQSLRAHTFDPPRDR